MRLKLRVTHTKEDQHDVGIVQSMTAQADNEDNPILAYCLSGVVLNVDFVPAGTLDNLKVGSQFWLEIGAIEK